jgi:hypothetical protein
MCLYQDILFFTIKLQHWGFLCSLIKEFLRVAYPLHKVIGVNIFLFSCRPKMLLPILLYLELMLNGQYLFASGICVLKYFTH